MTTQVTEHDCGSDQYLTVSITQETASTFLGRNIYHDNGLIMLTAENLPNFIDQTVQMRSPLCCRIEKGCCRICLGSGEQSPLDPELSEIFAAFRKDHLINLGLLRLRMAKHFQNPEARIAEVAAVRESLREFGIDLEAHPARPMRAIREYLQNSCRLLLRQ